MRALGLVIVQVLGAQSADFAGEDMQPARTGQAARAPQVRETWLLEVRLEQGVLADALAAEQRDSRVLVPLGELCRLLDIAVEVDATRGRASGFVLSQERLFDLDAAKRLVTVEGKSRSIGTGELEQIEDEIYVDAQALSRWLPLDLQIDLPNAVLRVRPREPLPLQQRLERERRARASAGTLELNDPGYPRAELPYQLWSVPFMDLRVLTSFESQPDGELRKTASYSALLTSDLLFLESTIQAAGGESRPLDILRLTIGRKDPNGGLLGPLAAREVSAGEISYPGSDLLAYSTPGRGFLISNHPLDQPSAYDGHIFRGPLPTGWDVELYHDDAFIAYQQSRPDGRYEFDVPLLFQLNRFRLVFYGPEGQRREETHTFNIGGSLTPPGRLRYRLAAAVTPAWRARTLLGVELGLTRNVSAVADVATVELPDGQHAYGKSGLRLFWGRLFATGVVVADARGGWGTQATAHTKLDGLGLSLSRLSVQDFHSERLAETFGPLSHRTTLRVDGVPLPRLPLKIPIVLEASRDDLVAGSSVRSFAGQVSASYRGFAFSNRLTLIDPPPGLGAALGTGVVRLSKTHPKVGVRAEAGYDVRPARQLTSVALTIEAQLAPSYRGSLGANHTASQGQNRFLAAVHKTAGMFGVGAQASYFPGRGASLMLSLVAGLARDQQANRWHSEARPITGGGGASARVFFDSNDNGALDPGERLIEGVAFTVNRGRHQARTGRNGTAFLGNLPSHQETDVGLSVATLEDPFWMLRRPGVRIIPRPGSVARLDFPIVMSGEIAGTVYRERNGTRRELSGITIELVDERGTVVKSARSAYDGFYELSLIAPGRYTLRVDPRQAKQLALVAEPRSIEMAPSGTVLDGVTFVLAPVPEMIAGIPGATAMSNGDRAPSPDDGRATPAAASRAPGALQ